MAITSPSQSAVLVVLGTLTGAALPLTVVAPAMAQQVEFSDVDANFWARPFIEELAAEGIIAGFPNKGAGPTNR